MSSPLTWAQRELMPHRKRSACKALSPGPGGVRGQGGARTVLVQLSHQGTRENWGLEGSGRRGGVSQSTCARAGPRQCQKMLSPDSPGLTPKSAGLPRGLREILMGCEVQTGGGPAWEGWGPARTPALCHARGPSVPALPCPHLPSAWSLGSWSPSCWVCSRDVPSAVRRQSHSWWDGRVGLNLLWSWAGWQH